MVAQQQIIFGSSFPLLSFMLTYTQPPVQRPGSTKAIQAYLAQLLLGFSMLVSCRMSCWRPTAMWTCTPSAFTCARRRTHSEPQPSDTHAPLSPQATKLRRAMWMRMHPVERWTSLVDLGRRGACLIDKPQEPTASVSATASAPSTSFRKRLGSADGKVSFSEASREAHQRLCAALPYAARLHVCTSLLMWVRCLRDVQDTLARVRLPYAVVRRLQRYAIADVFPTRLSEYWVDVHSTVSTKMSARLNSTAEQVPAPHTWDVETSETLEDAATESTITVDTGRILHGRKALLRLSGKALLQQVQELRPRESADDMVEAKVTSCGTVGGQRRRHRRRLLHSTGRGPTLAGALALSTDTAVELNAPTRRIGASGEFLPDAARRVPPVSLEAQSVEDAAYHGNTRRGEGCPINDDGEATPNPIYIDVPPCSNNVNSNVEAVVKHCVMAHAAILSSLYIEGRVVDFSTNDTSVAAYVEWLFQELIEDRYVNVLLIDTTTKKTPRYRPYFPAWCWRSVLVLIPPSHHQGYNRRSSRSAASYSIALIKDWAARVAQAAPCAVIVEGGEAAENGYVQQLKNEVQRLQRSSSDRATRTAVFPHRATARPTVEWVPVAMGDSLVDAPTSSTQEQKGESKAAATAAFQPQRSAASSRSSFSAITAAIHLLNCRSGKKTDGSNETVVTATQCTLRQQRFLHAVQETLQDRFYTCEFLYSPTQSCLTPYRFERWVWEQLPDNVRVVGVNTSPLDVLFYFPQGVFLTQKVGNAFRYRAIERTVVAKGLVPAWTSHPLRHTAAQLKRLQRRWWWPRHRNGNMAGGLHAELSLLDQSEICRASRNGADSVTDTDFICSESQSNLAQNRYTHDKKEVAANALVRERTVEYLAEPSKWTLFALATARLFRL